MVLKAPAFKFKPVNLKAPSGSKDTDLSKIFNVIFGVTLVAATIPLISAASS